MEEIWGREAFNSCIDEAVEEAAKNTELKDIKAAMNWILSKDE